MPQGLSLPIRPLRVEQKGPPSTHPRFKLVGMLCPLVCAVGSAAWSRCQVLTGKGTLTDGLWLSAFQGRLINFEKRRKVSSHSPHVGGGNQRLSLGRTFLTLSPFLIYGSGKLGTE